MKRLLALLILVPMLASAVEPAVAAKPAAVVAPPTKEIVCRACHGAGGAAPLMDLYPKLNGQNKGYLVSSLKAYKAGGRQGGMAGVMVGQAMSLSDADMDALASYYSSQP